MADSDNQERADRILDAASKLIVHYGYDKTTVSDIANEAGVSKGAIYLHWKSKDEVLEALIFRESDRLVEDMLARIEADPDAGTIFSLYQYAIVTTIANPLIHAVMTQDVRVLGDFTRRWIRANGGRAEEGNLFRDEMVKQLQEANVIRADLDAQMISYIMGLIRYGFLTVHDIIPPENTPPLQEVGKTLGLLLEKALEPEGGGDKEAGRQVLIQTLENLRELVRQFKEKR
ncbi:MAG: helix-turn-helix domain-containing protein [Chloroflexota bacterium]